MLKKQIITAVLVTLLSFAICVPASAAMLPDPEPVSVGETVSPNAEQTQWIFRVLEDGTLQKRLWSLTYQEWLTDWIDVPSV